jgi:hypothetical protein
MKKILLILLAANYTYAAQPHSQTPSNLLWSLFSSPYTAYTCLASGITLGWLYGKSYRADHALKKKQRQIDEDFHRISMISADVSTLCTNEKSLAAQQQRLRTYIQQLQLVSPEYQQHLMRTHAHAPHYGAIISSNLKNNAEKTMRSAHEELINSRLPREHYAEAMEFSNALVLSLQALGRERTELEHKQKMYDTYEKRSNIVLICSAALSGIGIASLLAKK